MKTNEAREVYPDMKVKKQMPTNACTGSLLSHVFLLLIAATTVSAAPASDPRTVLYDFERGAVHWKGNPWGTGKTRSETAAGARFGTGAMRLVYEETTKGASVIAPYFANRTPWRGKPWGGISFWARCLDDNLHKVNLHIETSQQGGGFSADFKLQGRQWRRYEATTASVWSREGLRIDWGAMKRFFFISYASVVFEVDQIVLEPVARELPLYAVPVVPCPRVGQAPNLDGVLEDSCWGSAGRTAGFVEHTKGAAARNPTEVRLCHDSTHMFIGARLSVADTSGTQATTHQDHSIDQGDCLKFFFGPEGDDAQYELALNALGKVSDSSSGRHLRFDADWQVKTCRTARGWTAEAAIHLRCLTRAGTAPVPGTIWDFNIGREGPTAGEITSWAFTQGSLDNCKSWGYLLFVGSSLPASPGSQPLLMELDYGEYAVRWAPPEEMASAQLATRIKACNDDGTSWAVSAKARESTSLKEPLLRLSHQLSSPAMARWCFSAVDAGGEVVAYAAGRFKVFPPEEPRPKPWLALLPQPKELRPGQGRFFLPSETHIDTVDVPPEEVGNLTGALVEPLRKCYGLGWGPGTEGAVTLVLAEKPEQVRAHFPGDRSAAFAALPAEGYLLEVTERGVAIAGKSARGVFYGIQTFLQAVGLATPVGQRPACPALSVRDFPTLGVRAVSMPFPNCRWGHPNDPPFEPERFKEYLERTLVRHKLNTLVLIVNQAIRLDSRPELAAPQAWSKAQVRDVLKFARRRYLEVVPLVTILGHAQWFTLNYKDLWEEGDHLIACVSHPKTQQILTDVVTEVAELFQPRRFHLGMDEAWWRTLDVPEQERCKLCAGKPKSEIFASQLLRYHSLLKARGIETMIWADMLLTEHNGGPPYHTARALEALPRDVILCNWSTGVVPLSSKRFQQMRFRVIQSNSAGINREQADWVIGNMMGCWSKAPWLALTTTDVQEFSYLPVLQSAERAWNPDADLQRDAWALSREFVDGRASEALALVARSPAPMAAGPAQPVSLADVVNLSTRAARPAAPGAWFGLAPGESLVNLPARKVTVGGLPFTLLPATRANAVAFGAQPVSIPVKGKKGALAFLYGCHLPDELRGTFLDRFKQKEAILGVPIGALRVSYADGTAATIELRYGLNVLAWKFGEKLLPYCYGATGSLAASTADMQARDPRGRDAFFFACDWGNPHPNKEIESIELISTGTEATPFLLAMTAWKTNEYSLTPE